MDGLGKSSVVVNREVEEPKDQNFSGSLIRCPLCGWSPRNEYEAALRLTPNRFDALYGAARSAAKSGRQVLSVKYFRKLLDNCAGSTSVRPELKEVAWP